MSQEAYSEISDQGPKPGRAQEGQAKPAPRKKGHAVELQGARDATSQFGFPLPTEERSLASVQRHMSLPLREEGKTRDSSSDLPNSIEDVASHAIYAGCLSSSTTIRKAAATAGKQTFSATSEFLSSC